MLTNVAGLGLLLALAVLVEMLVEYFISPLIPKDDNPGAWYNRVPIPRYASALFGVGATVLYGVDMIAMFFPEANALHPVVGMVITGLVISRGSNYVHDWIGQPFLKRIAK